MATHPLFRITKRRFRPDETGTIDFIRSPRPRRHFRTKPDGRVDEEELHGGGWVPWLWDPKPNAMLFLKMPGDVDLTRAVFVYHTMRLQATHMAVVPMADFERMAQRHQGHGKQIAWLYNVGRCGSTLLSHAISDATPSEGLSETGFHLQVLRIRKWMTPEQKVAYLRAMTHWYTDLFGPPDGKLVFKIPHPCTVIHDLIDASVPQAQPMFMYRDARKVVASSHRVSGSIHGKTRWAFRTPILNILARIIAMAFAALFNPWFRDVDNALGKPVGKRRLRRHGFVAVLTLMWVTDVDAYLRMRQERNVLAVRYEDLTPEAFPAILGQLGLGDVDVVALSKVMNRDSQAGTALSRKRKGIPLDDLDQRIIEEIVGLHASIGAADSVLPGTLQA